MYNPHKDLMILSKILREHPNLNRIVSSPSYIVLNLDGVKNQLVFDFNMTHDNPLKFFRVSVFTYKDHISSHRYNFNAEYYYEKDILKDIIEYVHALTQRSIIDYYKIPKLRTTEVGEKFIPVPKRIKTSRDFNHWLSEKNLE